MTAAMKDEESKPIPPKKRKKPVKAAPPVEHVVLPKPEDLEKKKSPYPEGVQVFSYTPEAGGEPILLALNGFDNPDKLWFFDTAQLPRLAQTWRWMDKANIPKAIQRQANMLPDAEYFAMFDKWFEAVTALRNGAKGAVTAGK